MIGVPCGSVNAYSACSAYRKRLALEFRTII